MFTTAGAERRERTLQLVQSQLRKVGVDVDLEFTTALFSTVLERGEFDLALFSWVQSAGLGGPYFTLRCQGEQNYTGYCARLVTRDLVRSVRILDFERRVRVLNKADVKLARDVPVIPLFQPPQLIALRANVRGVIANQAEKVHPGTRRTGGSRASFGRGLQLDDEPVVRELVAVRAGKLCPGGA